MKTRYSKQGIQFWKTQFGSLKTHNKGLTEDQVKFLQSLKPGDVLIMFMEDKQGENTAAGNLKKIEKDEQ